MNDKILTCPLCNEYLLNNLKTYVCKNMHSYDIASSGYVNLLPINKKKSLSPGDSKEMLINRAEFLYRGFYDELSKDINELLFNRYMVIQKREMNVLDSGCGIGYYLDKFHIHAIEKNFCCNLYGVDISKYAISIACKKNSSIKYVVASSFNLPIVDNSIDCIMSIFSPFSENEFIRVLKEGGLLIVVRKGEKHLDELTSLLYEERTFKNYTSKMKMSLILTKELKYEMLLPKKYRNSLLCMTPYFWNINRDKLGEVFDLDDMILTAHFIIDCYINI